MKKDKDEKDHFWKEPKTEKEKGKKKKAKSNKKKTKLKLSIPSRKGPGKKK